MPNWRDAILHRLVGLRLAPAREAEILDELSQHLEDRFNELRTAGVADEAAAREALSELDETDLVRELTRVERDTLQEPMAIGSAGPGRLTGGLWHDVRFGGRLLAKHKSVTLVIVVTLALAIAANAIVFGLADLLFIRPLPFANAARLTQVFAIDQRTGSDREVLSVPQFLDVARQASSFDQVAAMMPRQLSLTGVGEPQAVGALMVTANLFETVGLDAFAGRTFRPGEDTPGRSSVVALSHRFWTTRFGADRALIGRTVRLNGVDHTVVGVVTPAIEVGTMGQVDVWLPLETASVVNRRRERALAVFGRLSEGQTVATANAELATIATRLRRDYPVTDADLQLHALSSRSANVDTNTPTITALLAIIVGVVLLLACANVATVMLARATARQREMAVRLALGATRGRLVRQLISEGLLLGLLAGGVGVALAAAGVAGVRRLSPDAYVQLLAINTNLLLFVFALSLVAPVLFGVVPALRLSRPDLNDALKEGARDGGPSRRSTRGRTLLVVTQVAFALTVLIIAGLVVRSVIVQERTPLGVATDGVLCMRVRFDPPKYVDNAARVRAVNALLTRMNAVPGVVATAAMSRTPIVDTEPLQQFTIVGGPAPVPGQTPWAVESAITEAYGSTFSVPLVEGRLWTEDDRRLSAPVAALSREAAKRYWPGESPIGQRIVMLDGTGSPVGDPIEIVGVVDDVKSSAVTQPAPPRIYRPLTQTPENVAFAVRVRGDAAWSALSVREAVRDEDRDLAVADIRTFATMLEAQGRTRELLIALFTGFAGIGLVLAVTGVYGVTAFSVEQRRREVGLRLALGATTRDVIRLLVTRSFRPIATGMVLGTLGGWAISRTMRGQLFGTGVFDPSTYLTVIAIVAISGLIASLVPARRAASVDPMSVLKRE
ncbi:MAG TPA: ABC transporter permease [Vicinamibacterales bacterium]|nr:ABC transporter permease [Vicinamibacterales bacterium]